MKTSTLFIRTPEGIVFSQLLAGPVTRFFAWFIDQLCILVLPDGSGNRSCSLLEVLSFEFALRFLVIGWFVVGIGYGIFFEWSWRGQTIGKRLFRLRVVDAEGMRLQFNQIVVRNLLRFVDALPAVLFCRRPDLLAQLKMPAPGRHRRQHRCHPHPADLRAGSGPIARRQIQFAPAISAPRRAPAAECFTGGSGHRFAGAVATREFDPVARVELFGDLAGISAPKWISRRKPPTASPTNNIFGTSWTLFTAPPWKVRSKRRSPLNW